MGPNLREPAVYVPETGHLVGGRLHGWPYLLLCVHIVQDWPQLRARISAPAWPFPHECYLHYDYFDRFAMTSRTRLRPIGAEIDDAYRDVGRPVPDNFVFPCCFWLRDDWRIEKKPRLKGL